jgi:hypothetical protein
MSPLHAVERYTLHVNACIETRRSHSGFQGLMKPGAFISSYGLDCIQLHSTAFNCIQLHSTAFNLFVQPPHHLAQPCARLCSARGTPRRSLPRLGPARHSVGSVARSPALAQPVR